MGCNKSKNDVIQELNDMHEILKAENAALEEEKEALLRDQIDKPAEDKEILQSVRKMTLELEDYYRKSYAILQELITCAEYQKDGSPSSRVTQIFRLRLKLEEMYGRIENCYIQKKNYSTLNEQLRADIENERQKNKEIQDELQSCRDKEKVVMPG